MSELTLQAARKLDRTAVALSLAAILAVVGLIGLLVGQGYGEWGLQTLNPQHSRLDLKATPTATFTAFLMFVTAGLALALANVDRSRRRRKWQLVAFALVALALDQLLGLHPWLVSEGVSWSLAYPPLLAVALLPLIAAIQIFRSHRGDQAIFGLAIVLLLAAAVVDEPTLVGSEGGAEVLAMASASLFFVALLGRMRYLARQYYPLEEADTRLSVDQIAAEALSRVPLRGLAIGLVLVAAAETIQYVLFHDPGYPHCPAVLDGCHVRDAAPVAILDLNNEQTLAPVFQASVLLAGGALAIVAGRLRATRPAMRRWWLTLGVVMVVLSSEQVLAIHNRFGAATDLPGQAILLPLGIAGVIAWLKVLQDIWENGLARTLLIAGAVLWIASQASDLLLDGIDGLDWTTVPEETGETTGSMLWLFSILVWLRSKLPAGFTLPKRIIARKLDREPPIIAPLESGRLETPTG
jgi:hypothetical protein